MNASNILVDGFAWLGGVENGTDMFGEAGISIGINLLDRTYTFSSIGDAIRFILN